MEKLPDDQPFWGKEREGKKSIEGLITSNYLNI